MKLDEYKEQVEAQRLASLTNALSALTQANNVLEKTFNLDENE